MQRGRLSESADMSLGLRYSTMDNVDGKQARRTGQSSGLGELFEYVRYSRDAMMISLIVGQSWN